MRASTKKEILKHGDMAEIVSVDRLRDLGRDIENLKNSNELSGLQKFVVNDLYMLDLPRTDFTIRSIIIVASPSPAMAKVVFHLAGEKIDLKLPASYIDKETRPAAIGQYLGEFLNPQGYHALFAPRLPRKLLGARSGLSVYGRNNITYVQGMGSFHNLAPFFSDIPCLDNNWHELRPMELCADCAACLNNCPTQAIPPDRFLLHAERCLTNLNESLGSGDFPEWVHPSAHNAIYGCMRCQTVCPANAEYLDSTAEPVEFDEEESYCLFEGKPFEQFPDALVAKVKKLDMVEYLAVLPRNLRALLN